MNDRPASGFAAEVLHRDLHEVAVPLAGAGRGTDERGDVAQFLALDGDPRGHFRAGLQPDENAWSGAAAEEEVGLAVVRAGRVAEGPGGRTQGASSNPAKTSPPMGGTVGELVADPGGLACVNPGVRRR